MICQGYKGVQGGSPREGGPRGFQGVQGGRKGSKGVQGGPKGVEGVGSKGGPRGSKGVQGGPRGSTGLWHFARGSKEIQGALASARWLLDQLTNLIVVSAAGYPEQSGVRVCGW